ncbi:hypothetical protein A8C56_19875 [Niabella ginsenosidivorans]|uniref:Uncharacterized protein n=1 Tax=Niabella ginsenosidivorans TaxID=1176587 RepID=A0A1A9I6I5_9BACT|nr:hypothetical protein A8C56_19875 [Niabella ginsenosidivorans]
MLNSRPDEPGRVFQHLCIVSLNRPEAKQIPEQTRDDIFRVTNPIFFKSILFSCAGIFFQNSRLLHEKKIKQPLFFPFSDCVCFCFVFNIAYDSNMPPLQGLKAIKVFFTKIFAQWGYSS